MESRSTPCSTSAATRLVGLSNFKPYGSNVFHSGGSYVYDWILLICPEIRRFQALMLWCLTTLKHWLE
ncbi:hypothetical protein LINPERPRIM_LOCUS11260, partial [Linum perenne]